MVFTKNTTKKRFEKRFAFTNHYKNLTFPKLSSLIDFLNEQYTGNFHDEQLIAPAQVNNFSKKIDFQYVVAQFGHDQFISQEVIGFKLPGEKKYYLGSPHIEETIIKKKNSLLKSIIFYATPAKKIELGTQYIT